MIKPILHPLLMGVSLAFCAAAQAQDWQLAKDEEGIQVYLSAVPGSQYKVYRGETIIQASVARIRALQEDVGGSCAWIHQCKDQLLIRKEGTSSWTHTYFDTPWPVSPRDSLIEVTTEEQENGLLRQLKGVPDLLPEEKGYVRVARVDGFWKLEPLEDQRVKVTYQLHNEPGGSVPSWLANSFVIDAPFNTLKGLRSLAEEQ
jgi:hypothetical protein